MCICRYIYNRIFKIFENTFKKYKNSLTLLIYHETFFGTHIKVEYPGLRIAKDVNDHTQLENGLHVYAQTDHPPLPGCIPDNQQEKCLVPTIFGRPVLRFD